MVAAVARVLLNNIVGFDAAMGIRVILRSVEHGMSILHHESLLRLCVALLVGVSRAIRIDCGRLSHD